jgi:hypothetical protein
MYFFGTCLETGCSSTVALLRKRFTRRATALVLGADDSYGICLLSGYARAHSAQEIFPTGELKQKPIPLWARRCWLWKHNLFCVSALMPAEPATKGKAEKNGRGTEKEEWWLWRADLRVCHFPSWFGAPIVKTENPRFRRAKTARRGCVVPGNENAKTKLKGRETAKAARDLERLWLPG